MGWQDRRQVCVEVLDGHGLQFRPALTSMHLGDISCVVSSDGTMSNRLATREIDHSLDHHPGQQIVRPASPGASSPDSVRRTWPDDASGGPSLAATMINASLVTCLAAAARRSGVRGSLAL
jgi:hypothetical protein